jgi:Cdc6-like AAA superfamily ATPase
MMSNVFEPVRIKGKLFAKNTATGSIAPKDAIRHIQLLNAEKNREVLVVSVTGRITRIPASDMGVALTPPPVAKLSFMSTKAQQCPDEMFQNIERLTKMVGRGIQPSLVITGGAGTGKTYLVKSTLEGMGLKESTDFVHFKGRATPAGLFITLYENSNKIIVLDDCDSVFKDDDAVNILKGALDSYDTRKISYISTKTLKDEFGSEVPRHFEFTGRIIFISNINQSKLDEAIRSRSFVADVELTANQMFTRMAQLATKMESSIPQTAKDKALELMKELNEEYDGVEINLRSFIKAARICAMGFENPKMMIAEQIIPA